MGAARQALRPPKKNRNGARRGRGRKVESSLLARVETDTKVTPKRINFALGYPAEELLPLQLMREAAANRLAPNQDPGLLQYGDERGDELFLERLKEWLAFEDRAGGAPAGSAARLVTSGASQALDLLLTLRTRPGERVLVADATYFLALDLFRDHGLEIEALPTDEEGPVKAAVEEALKRPAPPVGLIYLVPAFANPTGATISNARAAELTLLAEEAGVLLVVDEVYRLLPFGGPPPPPLARGGGEQTVSINSFSKLLAPGLRLGWVEGHSSLVERLARSGLLLSGGGLNPFTSALVSELLATGATGKHLAFLRSEYEERAEILARALRSEAPDLKFGAPRGGFFIWAEAPGVDTTDLLSAARSEGVNFAPGSLFSPAAKHGSFMRLSFSHHSRSELQEGARRLGRAVRRVTNQE